MKPLGPVCKLCVLVPVLVHPHIACTHKFFWTRPTIHERHTYAKVFELGGWATECTPPNFKGLEILLGQEQTHQHAWDVCVLVRPIVQPTACVTLHITNHRC
jgi:hypothetical protein